MKRSAQLSYTITYKRQHYVISLCNIRLLPHEAVMTKDLTDLPINILDKMYDKIQIFIRTGINPLLSIANSLDEEEKKNRDPFFRHLKANGELSKLFAWHLKPKESYSWGETILSALYKIFGAEYVVLDPNALDINGKSALHHIFSSKFIIQTLVEEFKADIELRDPQSATPLMRAAEYGFGDTAVYLMQQKANLYALDIDGNNLLHYIAGQFKNRDKAGHLMAIEELKTLGALPALLEQKNKAGLTPLECLFDHDKKGKGTTKDDQLEQMFRKALNLEEPAEQSLSTSLSPSNNKMYAENISVDRRHSSISTSI